MEAQGTDTKHGRCCVCIGKKNIYTKKCEFAAYFPNEVQGDYEAPTKWFEGVAWTDDNIRGGYGMIQKLIKEIKLHETYLSMIRKKISEEKKLVLLLHQYIYNEI
uniref:LOB domain-containing protein n=1 Tax=Brassica campestris TaxID=3711 RepID=A0A3P5YT20_BRACM|nr:unnamed protein product [Brassica rapa]